MQIQSSVNQQEIIPIYNFKQSATDNNYSAVDSLIAEKKTTLNNTSAITIASIATVCGALMLSRGTQKNISKALNWIKDYFEEKRVHFSIKKTSKRAKFYENAVRKINSFINKSESINNITSLKDILFMKLMYKTEPTKDIHKAITKYFENISKKTVLDSYKTTKKQFNDMNKVIDELDEYILNNNADDIVKYNGKEYTKRELVKQAKNAREDANITLDVFLNKSTIEQRYKYIKNVTSSLYSNLWDASFKDFWSKNNKFKRKEMWQTFIAAEQIKGDKTALANLNSIARNVITYTKRDQINNIYEYITAIDNIIPNKDKIGIEIINKLKLFAKHTDILENNKEGFLQELEKLKNHKISIGSDDKMQNTIEDYKKTVVDIINKQITDTKEGALQEMLSIYYKIAPFELERFGVLTAIKRAVKSFDKSVYLESVELFDKVRDLRLGSAPTDILTIIFSFFTLSYGLGHAKDKDKRISITLRSGIPVMGGIATAMYSAARLVSGGKSLALGFLSGIVLNQLGKIVDNIRRNRKTTTSNSNIQENLK